MIDTRIKRFLKKHHVFTLATAVNNEPWCASCFYVFLEEERALVFTTGLQTRHGMELIKNPLVAGTVALETMVPGKIRGIQFQGIVSQPEGDLALRIKNAYIKRFPVAMLMDTNLWLLKLTFIKMTDNRLGFGKKLIWKP